MNGQATVLRVAQVDPEALRELLGRYSLTLDLRSEGTALPGSYWGETEAGLIADRLIVQPATPLHSVLHEAAHFMCASPRRRAALHTDAGSDDGEECAVCLMQILLADHVPGLGQARMLADMDRWGYSFRLGSALRWLATDADDARNWLYQHGLINVSGCLTWQLRGAIPAPRRVLP